MDPTNADILEVIRTLGTVATAIGVFTAIRHFRLNRAAVEAQHERAKKERAVSLLNEFSKNMGAPWRAATKLVESLDESRLGALYEGIPFEVRPDQVDLLLAAIPARSDDPSLREGLPPYELTAKEVFALRWEVVSCLNSVEFLCHAAFQDVADIEIVRVQLAGLWSPKNHQTFCRAYRDVSGGEAHYPMLYSFIAKYLDLPRRDPQPIWRGQSREREVPT